MWNVETIRDILRNLSLGHTLKERLRDHGNQKPNAPHVCSYAAKDCASCRIVSRYQSANVADLCERVVSPRFLQEWSYAHHYVERNVKKKESAALGSVKRTVTLCLSNTAFADL